MEVRPGWSLPQRRCSLGRGSILALLTLSLLTLAHSHRLPGLSYRRKGRRSQVELNLLTEKAIGPATFEVLLRTPDGKPLDGAEVTVRGDMNHAGMKPVLAATRGEGAGRYVTEDFKFTMGGDWILTAEVVLPGGEKVAHTVDISGVARR